MNLTLAGQGVLVTGGSGGIGQAVLQAFASAGARVANLDVPPPPGDEAGLHVEVDLADPAAVEVAVGKAVAALGQLDHVVYCAGITRDRVLWKLSDEDWSQVLGVNLSGAFHVLRAATPHLRERSAGSVVLVASINGERGKRGQANYSASKGGLIALGKAAARELGHFGVRVNVVSPGLIHTAMTAALPEAALAQAREDALLNRDGRPEDVANVALFLASDLAAHVTGQVIRVDGGQLVC